MNNTAIILLNYNSWPDTLECLESLLKQKTKLAYTIFIVDNSQNNESIHKIKDWAAGEISVNETSFHPEITSPEVRKPLEIQYYTEDKLNNCVITANLILIKANTNNGFSAGNNIALKYLKDQPNEYDWIWLLNNDTIVKSQAIENIISEIKSHKNELILFGTPLMEYYDASKIQAIGGKYNKYLGRPSLVGAELNYNHEIRVQQYKVDYPIGASMILSKYSLQKLGLLSESYFLFFEELDWTLRIKKLGGKLKILDNFDVLHKQGASTKQNVKRDYNIFMETLLIKNRLVFAKKHNRSNIKIVKLSIIFLVIPKKFIKGQFALVKEIIKIVFN